MRENFDLQSRLARIESRLVEGFKQLGANVKNKPSVLITVDNEKKIVYVPHENVSLGDILKLVPEEAEYDVLLSNNKAFLCTIFT